MREQEERIQYRIPKGRFDDQSATSEIGVQRRVQNSTRPLGGIGALKTSIIIPAYNSERFIDKTIASIVSQTYSDWELVVVDDGSKDSTSEIVERHAAKDPRIRLVRQENGGIAEARNRGYAESSPSSPFVVFFDHDDLWKNDALETLIRALEANPSAPAAYGISRFIDDKDEAYMPGCLEEWHRERQYVQDGQVLTLPIDSPTTFAAQMYQNKINTMGQVLIRRSVLSTLSPVMDPKMVPCDDWDLYLRLAQKGDIVYLPRLVLDRRLHGSNVSNDQAIMSLSEGYIRRVYASSKSLSEQHRKVARRVYRVWSRQILQYRLEWAKDCYKERKFVEWAKQLRHAALIYARLMVPSR